MKFYRTSSGKLTFRTQNDTDKANFRCMENKKIFILRSFAIEIICSGGRNYKMSNFESVNSQEILSPMTISIRRGSWVDDVKVLVNCETCLTLILFSVAGHCPIMCWCIVRGWQNLQWLRQTLQGLELHFRSKSSLSSSLLFFRRNLRTILTH